MRRSSVLLPLLLVMLAAAPPEARSGAAGGLEFPMGRGKLSLRDGTPSRRRIALQARWQGAGGTVYNPTFATATLRVAGTGDGDGDSGVIELPRARWKALGRGRGFRYVDARGSAGGVRLVVLKLTKRGGSLRIVGGKGNWRYAIDNPQEGVVVTLTIGPARWCAEFAPPRLRTRARRVTASSLAAPAGCPCVGFASTWEAIQQNVFARHGCTEAACHGDARSGGLDLRPDVAYANLVDVPSQGLPATKRVEPGNRNASLLWLKLAKATIGAGYEWVPGAPMPNGAPPLSEDLLEAVRQWIKFGAPETGVVEGTDRLLGTCLPPPDPIKIRPAPVPAVDEGVQLHAPPWTIPPRNADGLNGEAEVCYATYYDFTDRIPPQRKVPCPDYWGGPTKECYLFTRRVLTQDPNSHHSIIHLYRGRYDVAAPPRTRYTCRGGDQAGIPCDPTKPGVAAPDGADCGGPRTRCDLDPGFGAWTCNGGPTPGLPCVPTATGVPAPAGADCGAGGACTGAVVRTVACIGYGPHDYGFSIAGTGTDNAPSIGGSQQPHLDEVYPPGVYGVFPVKGVLVWNSHAFNVTDRPTTNEQYYNIYFPPAEFYALPAAERRIVRGIFDAKDIFVQNVPPYEEREYCSTHTLPPGARLFELSSHTHKRGVLFRIWAPPVVPCRPGPDCLPEPRPPLVVTTDYSDPVQYRFPVPEPYDAPDVASRTFKYCGVFDNGRTSRAEVKRQSTSPQALVGGKCRPDELECLAASPDDPRKGRRCGGDHRVCDSAPGAGDGVCDACPVVGGVTTEDEMFILLGSGYCAAGTPCETEPF